MSERSTNQTERVSISIEAELIEEYPDGSARVDADGVEFLVESGEWR